MKKVRFPNYPPPPVRRGRAGEGAMPIRSSSVWLVLFLAATACTHDPFPAEQPSTLQTPDPAAIRESFAKSLPDHFISDDTIIVQAPFHDDLAFLGVLRVDRSKKTFELAGLNHTGIKLFEIAGNPDGSIVIKDAVPPLMQQKEILLAVGTDIQRMFLDLTPDQNAKVTVDKTEIKFKTGDIVRKLGGSPVVLLEKREDGFFGAAWRVRYYRYTSSDGKLYPRGLVMDNGHYHYRIIVKNRDIDFDQ
jgi:hypothetical protein